MKRKIIISILLVFLLIFFININKSNAAVLESNEYIDNFNSEDVSDSFIKNDKAKINVSHHALRFTPSSYSWTSHVIYNGYKIEKDAMIEFETLPIDKEGFWFAMSFGSQNPSINFARSGGAILFNRELTTLLFLNDGDSIQTDNTLYNLNPFDNERSTVQIEFKKIDKDLYDIDYRIIDSNTKVLTGEEHFKNIETKDGYIGFNSNMFNVDILNFKIYENGEVIIDDNFSKSSLLYSTSGDASSKWEALEFNEKDVALGPIGALDLSIEGAKVIYSKPFIKDSNNESLTLYRLSFNIDFKSMGINSYTGVLLGLSDTESETNFIGFRKNIIGYSIKLNDEIEEVTLSPQNQILGVVIEIEFDGTVRVKTSTGTEFIASINDVNGYFGFTNLRCADGEFKGALIDDFTYTKFIYKDRSSSDASINFNGTKKTVVEGEDTYYEYYVSSKEWYKGPNVNLAFYRTQDKGNGYITFSQSNTNTSFGPRAKYKDYICTFEVTFIKNPEIGEWFGLEFGKPSYDMNNQNTHSLGFSYYDNNTVIQASNGKLSNGETYNAFLDSNGTPINIFKENGKYTLMYIVKNSCVRMFIKEGFDNNDLNFIEVDRIDNVDTDGYVAVYGANGVSFRLDNLSIRNLDFDASKSNEVVSDYLETFRLDFKNDKTFDQLELNNSEIKNGELYIKDSGYAKTRSLALNNILRFTIENIESSLKINHGNLEIIISNNELKVTSNGETQTVNIKEIDLLGATFEIEEINDSLIIHYSQASEPTSSIYNNKYKFSITPNEVSNLYISGQAGDLGLSKMSMFNLDSNVTIENRDFNPDTDVNDIWYYRPTLNDINNKNKNDKGCKSIIVSIITPLLLIPTIIYFKKKKENV